MNGPILQQNNTKTLLPQFTQCEIDNLNSYSAIIKEIEFIILKFPQIEISRTRWLYWRSLPNI